MTTINSAISDLRDCGWSASRLVLNEARNRELNGLFSVKFEINNQLPSDRMLLTAEGGQSILGIVYIVGLPVRAESAEEAAEELRARDRVIPQTLSIDAVDADNIYQELAQRLRREGR